MQVTPFKLIAFAPGKAMGHFTGTNQHAAQVKCGGNIYIGTYHTENIKSYLLSATVH